MYLRTLNRLWRHFLLQSKEQWPIEIDRSDNGGDAARSVRPSSTIVMGSIAIAVVRGRGECDAVSTNCNVVPPDRRLPRAHGCVVGTNTAFPSPPTPSGQGRAQGREGAEVGRKWRGKRGFRWLYRRLTANSTLLGALLSVSPWQHGPLELRTELFWQKFLNLKP